MSEQLTVQRAAHWTERWDRQQERYATGREERFSVIADVVEEAAADHGDPLILDIGCGPGSLAARLAARLPGAEIVGVDEDPLLLGLAEAGAPDGVRYTRIRAGAPGWTGLLGLAGRPVDAVVSSTALHYPPEHRLLDLYRDLGLLLRPGGVLVNADQLPPTDPMVARYASAVDTRAAHRRGVPRQEDWQTWWAAVARAPELAPLLAARERCGLGPGADNGLSLDGHLALLEKAGFRTAGVVWRCGTSCVLVAVR
ncbi:class I SAM-dependent methyltransferase [Streptomyces sodiiphilus]|uniref:Class I SAM-dependent methyltransferase n=1 Tax=Streptomyces sodiiphilus TaxID=226217 RepID=A0ABN2P424_9ACTN